MATQEDDLPDEFQEILRQAEELRLRRAHRSGLGRRFTEELQQVIDRNSVKDQTLRDALTRVLALIREQIGRAHFRVAYGYAQPPMCEEARMHLGDLLAEKKISQDEWRRAHWQRLIRIGDDGGIDVVGPPKRNFFVGKIVALPLVIAASLSIVMILDEPFNFANSVLLGLLLGVLLGGTGKAIYDCSWGHQLLATKLRYLCPVLRLRLN